MKKSSKRTPRPVNKHAFLTVIDGFKPLTEEQKLLLFKRTIKALNSMQFGVNLTKYDFTSLCDMLNISLLLAEKGNGRDSLPELYEAREALQDATQRFINTEKLGFYGPELKAVKVALTIHQSQLELCTFGELNEALNEQERRIAKGKTYKRDGDLTIQQRIAA